MLDTHPCFIFPFIVLPDRPLQSTLEPRSQSTPEVATTTSRPPETRTRSSLEVPRQEALPFRSIVVAFVLAILWQIMCILCLYSDTIASADLYVFGSVGPPLSCNILVYPFVSSVVL